MLAVIEPDPTTEISGDADESLTIRFSPVNTIFPLPPVVFTSALIVKSSGSGTATSSVAVSMMLPPAVSRTSSVTVSGLSVIIVIPPFALTPSAALMPPIVNAPVFDKKTPPVPPAASTLATTNSNGSAPLAMPVADVSTR